MEEVSNTMAQTGLIPRPQFSRLSMDGTPSKLESHALSLPALVIFSGNYALKKPTRAIASCRVACRNRVQRSLSRALVLATPAGRA